MLRTALLALAAADALRGAAVGRDKVIVVGLLYRKTLVDGLTLGIVEGAPRMTSTTLPTARHSASDRGSKRSMNDMLSSNCSGDDIPLSTVMTPSNDAA